VITGQRIQDPLQADVPLRNWPTALRFQPTLAERQEARSASSPELQFPVALSTDALTFVAMTPCRVLDTRKPPGPLGGPALTPGFPVRTFPILSACGIPSIAQAYSFNVTVVPTTPGGLSFLTVAPSIPCCAPPSISTLNDFTGLILANAAIVPAGPGGAVDVYATNPTHLIIDINGYFAAPTDNTTLNGNTALGYQSLFNMSTATPGIQNTAVGWAAGHDNTVGSQNTLLGNGAGYTNNGSLNTFTGTEAGYFKQVGDLNAFYGYRAGYRNYTGKFNTYLGTQAGFYNDGSNNTFVGFDAGWNPCGIPCVGNGSDNTFVGFQAGFINISGNHNTYIGENAGNGPPVTGGSYNTFLGDSAGINGGGSSNIYVMNAGAAGGENNTIRIGTQGIGNGQQDNAYMAGIWNVPVPNGVPVLIDSTGHLGTVPSSRRYKDDIQDMAQTSSGLLQLRPVTFRYKGSQSDEFNAIDYGLIAEEVAAVYPNLVARGTNGQIETVLYHKLTPMLLNELQRQDSEIHRQAETIQRQQEENRSLEDRVAALEALLSGEGLRRRK
jgi:hypothetical protein